MKENSDLSIKFSLILKKTVNCLCLLFCVIFRIEQTMFIMVWKIVNSIVLLDNLADISVTKPSYCTQCSYYLYFNPLSMTRVGKKLPLKYLVISTEFSMTLIVL